MSNKEEVKREVAEAYKELYYKLTEYENELREAGMNLTANAYFEERKYMLKQARMMGVRGIEVPLTI